MIITTLNDLKNFEDICIQPAQQQVQGNNLNCQVLQSLNPTNVTVIGSQGQLEITQEIQPGGCKGGVDAITYEDIGPPLQENNYYKLINDSSCISVNTWEEWKRRHAIQTNNGQLTSPTTNNDTECFGGVPESDD